MRYGPPQTRLTNALRYARTAITRRESPEPHRILRRAHWSQQCVWALILATVLSAACRVASVTPPAPPIAGQTMISGKLVSDRGVGRAGVPVRLVATLGGEQLEMTTTDADGLFWLRTGHSGVITLQVMDQPGGYPSFNLVPSAAPLTVDLQPGPDGLQARVNPQDSDAAIVVATSARYMRFESQVVRLTMAAPGRAPIKDESEAIAAVFDTMAIVVAAENPGMQRTAALVAYYRLLQIVTGLRGSGGLEQARHPDFASLLLESLPASSPLWGLTREPLAWFVVAQTDDPTRYVAAAMAIIEHADPTIAGPLLIQHAQVIAAGGTTPQNGGDLQNILELPKWRDTAFPADVKRITYSPIAAGKPAPKLLIPPLRIGDPPITSESLAGKPYLVDVWGTWCKPCVAERSLLRQAAQRYAGPDGDLQIVSILIDDRETAEQFLTHTPTPGQLGFLSLQGSESRELAQALGSEDLRLPLMLLVNAEGTILASTAALHADRFLQTLDTHLSRGPELLSPPSQP